MDKQEIIDLAVTKEYSKVVADDFYNGVTAKRKDDLDQAEIWNIQVWLKDNHSVEWTSIKHPDNKLRFVKCSKKYTDLISVDYLPNGRVKLICTSGDFEKDYDIDQNKTVYEALELI